MLRHFACFILLIITVHLAWDASTSPEVTGYKLYYGTASRTYLAPVDVGLVTDYQLPNVDETQPMFFAVTAYTATEESYYSVEIEAVTSTENRKMARGNINDAYVLTIVDGVVDKVQHKQLPTITGLPFN
jgi:hypothetical protein